MLGTGQQWPSSAGDKTWRRISVSITCDELYVVLCYVHLSFVVVVAAAAAAVPPSSILLPTLQWGKPQEKDQYSREHLILYYMGRSSIN